jgi:hypothetical protein
MRNSERKVPTEEECAAYDGEHCRALWMGCAGDWRCPGCNRTKCELLRWTKKIWPPGIGPDRTKPHLGWKAGLHRHHDHGIDYGKKSRFSETVICDHCNLVDVRVRRRIVGMRKDFSFSPAEIRQIVLATPHCGHWIDFDKARVIYESWLTTNSTV